MPFMSTTPTTDVPAFPVLAILPGGAETQTIRRLLEDEDVAAMVRDPSEGPKVWQDAVACRALIVDESLEPAAIAEALEEGWIPRTAPVFVLARRLPDRERYLAWLEAGAWDILKIPLESVALALRLRNILRARDRAPAGETPRRRYPREALVRVADETLALAQRHRRSFHCAAVAVDVQDETGSVHALLERLADASHRLIRRSDLIGVGDGLLFVLLPDTDRPGARAFVDRLDRFLQERLVAWGLAGDVRTGLAGAEARDGRELLAAAARDIQSS
jgi:DNA-binding response OmpR family regulator